VRGSGIAARSAVDPPATCAGLDKLTHGSNSDERNVYCAGTITKYAHQRFIDDLCALFPMWAYGGLAVWGFGMQQEVPSAFQLHVQDLTSLLNAPTVIHATYTARELS
jgi:hypothetical protein